MIDDFKTNKIQMALGKAIKKVVQEKLGTLLTSINKVRHRRSLRKPKIRIKRSDSQPQEPIRISVVGSLSDNALENEGVENDPAEG